MKAYLLIASAFLMLGCNPSSNSETQISDPEVSVNVEPTNISENIEQSVVVEKKVSEVTTTVKGNVELKNNVSYTHFGVSGGAVGRYQ
jgi:uncharacterized protein YcfL